MAGREGRCRRRRRRNPQDLDDAALATAVYLCSGKEDLSTRKGQEAAVHRYNHSQDYVDLVLRLMEAYSSGDYTAVPSGTRAGTTFTPSYSSALDRTSLVAQQRKAKAKAKAARLRQQRAATKRGAGTTTGATTGSGTAGGTTASGGSGTLPGSNGPRPNDGGSGVLGTVKKGLEDTVGGLTGSGPSGGSTPAPPKTPKPAPKPAPTPPPVKETISKVKAAALCTAKGLVDNPLDAHDGYDTCMKGYGY